MREILPHAELSYSLLAIQLFYITSRVKFPFQNTLRLRQDGRHFADDIFRCIFVNENVRILLKISLKFVPKDRINNIPALAQIRTWHRPGDKSLSEPLPTHICATRH